MPATSSGIVPAVNTTPPANTTFNDDYAAFDEGVKPAFKGMFVYLDDNTEFDVKELRGKYEYQVSVNKTSFDTTANLKASGKSKSTYFLVNNLERVRWPWCPKGPSLWVGMRKKQTTVYV